MPDPIVVRRTYQIKKKNDISIQRRLKRLNDRLKKEGSSKRASQSTIVNALLEAGIKAIDVDGL